jgi:hypothetical protein
LAILWLFVFAVLLSLLFMHLCTHFMHIFPSKVSFMHLVKGSGFVEAGNFTGDNFIDAAATVEMMRQCHL